ncbi:MAG: SPFH domain-containing protein [Pirellulaceae bacterium]|nr:SPFH domain-containing protein [Pirellulaceae bacterium]
MSHASTTTNIIDEKNYKPQAGWVILPISLGLFFGGIALFVITLAHLQSFIPLISAIAMFICGLISFFGFMAIAPNDSRVLLLFGEYKGTARESGFFWVNPFFSKKKLSLRIRNFETGSIVHPEEKNPGTGQVIRKKSRSSGKPAKVNDRDGNPIEISAVVVWKVVNTAEALFEVNDYEDFISVQSESALRNLASRHPYDCEDHELSLRGSITEVCVQLQQDIQERLDQAGIEILEARISHLAYAPEIASAMLQRQQAGAVVAARTKIVDGAVGMVELALDQLKNKGIIDLDDERRAAMVSNLLVVLCSDRHTQPVINTGSLYQ